MNISLKQKDSLFIFWMLFPAIFIQLLVIYFPLSQGFVMAFQNYNLFNLKNTKFIGFDNFAELFSTSPLNTFYDTIWNTVLWVGLSVAFQFLIGFAISLLVNKKFYGRNVYLGVVFFPWAVSGFIIGIMWRWMFNGNSGVINDILLRLGILDAPFGFLSSTSSSLYAVIIANIWYGIPFFIIMITAALQGVPKDLYEAADIDGAGAVTKFKVVTLPVIKPILILTVLLRCLWIFNSPDTIYSMTGGGPAGSSQIMTSFMMEKIRGLDYGMGSAVGVVCMLFLSIMTLMYLAATRSNKEDRH